MDRANTAHTRMENGPENVNIQKMSSVSDSPMSVLSQISRTPLMDVKNQFRSNARQRMSTGSMKSSGYNVKHRLSLSDQETIENVQIHNNAKIFKQPNDKEENVALILPVTHSANEESCKRDDTSALVQSHCDMSTFADTVDESILQEKLGELSMGANEISADGEFLKDVMLVLDQDMHISDNLMENPLEQEESIYLPSLETSNVESTQQILSDIQAITLDQTLKGMEFKLENTSMKGGSHQGEASVDEQDVSEHYFIVEENSGKASSLKYLPISEQSTTRLDSFSKDEINSMVESDSELTFSEAVDNSFGHLSSSLRESENDSEMIMMSPKDIEIVGEDMHELSSIRVVEGSDDSAFNILFENTLTEELQNFELHANHSEVDRNIDLQGNFVKDKSENEEACSSELPCSVGFHANRNLEEGSNEFSNSSQSLLVDLSISEAEVLNCFDCTADMSTFIDEFLKETPVLEQTRHMPARIKPQSVGKRDDFWPSEKHGNDDAHQDHPCILDAGQSVSVGNKEQFSESVDHESEVSLSSENNPAAEGMVSDPSGTNEQLSQEVKTDEVTTGEGEKALPIIFDGELKMADIDNLSDKEGLVDGDGVSNVSSELLSANPLHRLEKVCEPADLYSCRVTKVLETLREVCVASSNVEEFSDLESQGEISKRSAGIESVDLVGQFIADANGVSSDEVVNVKDVSNQANDGSMVHRDPSKTNNASKSDALIFVTHGEQPSESTNSESSCRVDKLDVSIRLEGDKLSVEEDEPESATCGSDSSNEEDERDSDNLKQNSLNRSTVEMKEEIQILEAQMAEMKEKVAWLESQIESNNQQQGEQAQLVKSKDDAVCENVSDFQLNETKRLMGDLEGRLAEELSKTQDLEGHVKDMEKKCSLLEKERLNSELNFAKEVRRLKGEYTKSVWHQQTEEEHNVEVLHQEFECMMLEFERLTTFQTKLKNMLNRVMRTTNESLVGYAKLLKDYSELQQKHQSVETQLSTSKADNKRVVDDTEVLENLLQRSNDSINDLHQLYQDEIETLKSQVATLSEALDVAAKEKEATKKGLENHVDQLQQSLDRLESERHMGQEELEDIRFLLEHQKTKNQMLSDEVDELRKIKVDWTAGQDWIKELQDTISFLNEEKEASDAEYEAAKKNTATLEEKINSLKEANEEYQSSQDQLQNEVSGLREKLFVTGEDVTVLLATLENIESMAESLLGSLEQKFGTESCESTKATPKQLMGPSSLVAQVLSRVGVEDGQLTSSCSKLSSIKSKSFCRQDNLHYSSVTKMNTGSTDNSQSHILSQSSTRVPSSRKALNFSSPNDSEAGGRAQSAIPSSQLYECSTAAGSQDNGDGLNTSVAGFAHIRSIPLSQAENEKEERLSWASEDLNMVTVCENVWESIDQKFSMIMKIAHTTDRASRIKIRELRGEVELLSEEYKRKRGLAEKLDTELESKSNQLSESRREIEQLNERVNRMTKAILKHEDMTYELKRLEEDNLDLHQELANLKGERDMLSTQVQDLIRKASGGEGEQASLKKIAALEKKIYQLNRYMLQEQEKTTEKGDKAMRRIRVLEMNLKRAEEEVYKFDELVEAIRNTCIENRSMRPHPVLLHVVRLIDGLVEVEKKSLAGKGKDSSRASSSTSSSTSRMSTSATKGKKVEEYRV